MWHIFTFVCLLLVNLNSSQSKSPHRLHSRDDHGDIVTSNVSSINESCVQSINIDTAKNNQTIPITSFWKPIIPEKDGGESGESEEDSTSSKYIQVIFTIPYTISNGSILNLTVSITDPIHNQIIPSLIHICINSSSFIINYLTNQSLPHYICLYVSLLATPLKEIFICRTISKDIQPDDDDDETHDGHTGTGPSAIFIVLQCVLILLMMLFICVIEISRKNHIVDRVSKRLFRHPQVRRMAAADILNESINRRGTSHEIQLNTEQQVLDANGLTPTHNERRFTNHTLMNITELTKRLS